MLQIQVQFVECVSAVYCRHRRSLVALHHMFCHRCASATRSDSVRRPIRFRPPSDQIPSATQSDSVRHPIRFRPPPVGGYGILPYPRSPHRGCSGLRCTNQAINHQTTKQTPTNQRIECTPSGGHTLDSSARQAVSLLNQGFGVESTDAIALIINYLSTPLGRAFVECFIG